MSSVSLASLPGSLCPNLHGQRGLADVEELPPVPRKSSAVSKTGGSRPHADQARILPTSNSFTLSFIQKPQHKAMAGGEGSRAAIHHCHCQGGRAEPPGSSALVTITFLMKICGAAGRGFSHVVSGRQGGGRPQAELMGMELLGTGRAERDE